MFNATCSNLVGRYLYAKEYSSVTYGGPMQFEVTDSDTATALGSGDVPVLATPRLIAWMEAATVQAAAAFLATGQTTVGTAIRIEHSRATPIGERIEVTATPPREAAGRRLTFDVRAIDGFGQVVGAGEIQRVIVDRERFLEAARSR
jgi:predicted thioesterase